jgi:hypothetical protein
MKITDWLHTHLQYWKRDKKIHGILWLILFGVYLFDLVAAHSGAGFPFDGLRLTVLTLVSCFITVYFCSIEQAHRLVFDLFKNNQQNSLDEKLLQDSVIRLLVSVIKYSTIASVSAFFIGYLLCFQSFEHNQLDDLIKVMRANHVEPSTGLVDYYYKNPYLYNTRFYLKESLDGHIYTQLVHHFFAATRSVPESFLAAFLFIGYESIKVLNPIYQLRLKLEHEKSILIAENEKAQLSLAFEKQENKKNQLSLDFEKQENKKNQLSLDFVKQEDWFHFSSNIFSGALDGVRELEKKFPDELHQEYTKVKTYLKSLSGLFRYRNAHVFSSMIKLKEEVVAVRALSAILEHRVPTFKLDLSEIEMDLPEDVEIVPGVLYELVWNAYKHSEGALPRFAKVVLSLNSAYNLYFEVKNSCGTSNQKEVGNEYEGGNGLIILKQRLDLTYSNYDWEQTKEAKEDYMEYSVLFKVLLHSKLK